MDLGGLKPAASAGAKATTLYKAHVVYNDFVRSLCFHIH